MVEPAIFDLARAIYESETGNSRDFSDMVKAGAGGPWFKRAYSIDAALATRGMSLEIDHHECNA